MIEWDFEADVKNVLVVRSAGRVYLDILKKGVLNGWKWDVLVTNQAGQDTDPPPRGEVIEFPAHRFNPSQITSVFLEKMEDKIYDLVIITYNSFYDFHYTAVEKTLKKLHTNRLGGIDQGINAVPLTLPQLVRWRLMRRGLYLSRHYLVPGYVRFFDYHERYRIM